jgi:site-specific DNA-methyltransferase (cytosine-N4-specific)
MRTKKTQFSLELKCESSDIILKLKTYIQPFEKYLANAELCGLVNFNTKKPFEESANLTFRLPLSACNYEMLKNRLAYWEQIGTFDSEPTFQVLLESEGDIHSEGFEQVRFHKSRRLRYGPHGLHEYRGKFFPQMVKSLINFAGLQPSDIVIDPMCGSGTTNCESRAMGMRTLGLDLNPLSVKMSRVKTALYGNDSELLSKAVSDVLVQIRDIKVSNLHLNQLWSQIELNYLLRWFSEGTLCELSEILTIIRSCNLEYAKEFMEICLSNIIRKVSWQKDTDLRVRKEIKGYNLGLCKELAYKEIETNLSKILSHLAYFDKNWIYEDFIIKQGDSREVTRHFEEFVGRCDVLITSPPYAMALPYIDTDRLSLVILGLLPRKQHRALEFDMIGNREISEKQRLSLWNEYTSQFRVLPKSVVSFINMISSTNHKEGIGFRRKNLPALLGKYFFDMRTAMLNAHKMVKPGSFAFYVVGNNSTIISGERVIIPTAEFLWDIADVVGWQQRKILNMELLPSRDIFKENRGNAEYILCLQA